VAHRKIVAAWMDLGELGRKMMMGGTAKRCFEEVLRYEPDHARARERLGYVWQGRAWVRDPKKRVPDRDPPAEFLSGSIARRVAEQRRRTERTVGGELEKLARWCEDNDLPADARKAWEGLLRLRPDDEELKKRLARSVPAGPVPDREVALVEAALDSEALTADERVWGLLLRLPEGKDVTLPGGVVRAKRTRGGAELTAGGAVHGVRLGGGPARIDLTGVGPGGRALPVVVLRHPRFDQLFLAGARTRKADLGGDAAVVLVDADLDGDPGGVKDVVLVKREGRVWTLPRLRTLPLPGGHDTLLVDVTREKATLRQIHGIPDADRMEALVLLNVFRRESGLVESAYDAKITANAVKHCDYMKRNGMRSGSGTTHDEDPSKPGYSPEGLRAAKNSSISTTDQPAARNMAETIATFYHRLMLIHPGTRKVGIARAHGSNMIDVYSGLDRNVRDPGPVVTPAPGTFDVPRALHGEWPDPTPGHGGAVGYPVTIRLGLRPARVEDVEARLREAGGGEVPSAVSWPGHPANDRFEDNWNTIAILPLRHLRKHVEHEVEVTAVVNGRERTWRWTFHTGKDRFAATWRPLPRR
jgi:hypothetical protein